MQSYKKSSNLRSFKSIAHKRYDYAQHCLQVPILINNKSVFSILIRTNFNVISNLQWQKFSSEIGTVPNANRSTSKSDRRALNAQRSAKTLISSHPRHLIRLLRTIKNKPTFVVAIGGVPMMIVALLILHRAKIASNAVLINRNKITVPEMIWSFDDMMLFVWCRVGVFGLSVC